MNQLTTAFAELFIIIDGRTGKQACSGVWSHSMAWSQIESFKRRRIAGGRPDIDDETLQNLTVKRWDGNDSTA